MHNYDKKTWQTLYNGGFINEKGRDSCKKRREIRDEGIEYAKHTGQRTGMFGVSIMFVVLLIYTLIKGLDVNSLLALYWAYFGVENYSIYRFTKQTTDLISGALGVATGIVFFAAYIIDTLWGRAMKDELTLKNHLKDVRTERNLSQSQLAELVGCQETP